MNKLKSYVGPSVSGFIWGTLAFIFASLLTGPITNQLEATQELALWSMGGALIAFAIAFVGDQIV